MTTFTEGRLQAYEHMMRDTGKTRRYAEGTSSGKRFSPEKPKPAVSEAGESKPEPVKV